jgi:DNA recombination protein RmuC
MNDASALLSAPAIRLGDTILTLGHLIFGALVLLVALIVLLVWLAMRAAAARRETAEEAARLARESEARLAEITARRPVAEAEPALHG